MFENFFNKKEDPIRGLAGLGGGFASRLTGKVELPFFATGGTEFISGDYKVHIFTSTDTLEVTSAPSKSKVQYLIIGGGGTNPSPGNASGGAGAGGFVTGTSSEGAISVGSHLITVGGGGSPSYIFNPAVIPARTPGTITEEAIRGGSGATPGILGSPGGSGGGGSYSYLGGLSGQSGQGNPGGSGVNAYPIYRAGGGGGGAGGGGENAYGVAPNPGVWGTGFSRGGDGGIGKAAFDGWSGIPPSYGEANPASPGRWFGGGGAGWQNPLSNPGYPTFAPFGNGGGIGGGGNGSNEGVPSPVPLSIYQGQVNTGGGAGAASPVATPISGGSGIVIIRYLTNGTYDYPTLTPA